MNPDDLWREARATMATGGYGSYGDYGRYPGVKGALPVCAQHGCQAPELARMLDSTTNHLREVMRIIQEKGVKMEPTRSLWCEQGGHSFSEKDPDYQVLSISGKDKDGKPVTESRTLCGPCASQAKVNLGSARNNPAAQIPAGSEEQR